VCSLKETRAELLSQLSNSNTSINQLTAQLEQASKQAADIQHHKDGEIAALQTQVQSTL
jgi:hypothetical protein